ncbi:DUF305 domain-containing protein [Streptomyces sp. 4N509B]|uniref:DUF305 domain-containing protein n=1 Tax=Streptomyces sp. 4N509B TaxID=3457413 RepID=UPI003FD5671F
MTHGCWPTRRGRLALRAVVLAAVLAGGGACTGGGDGDGGATGAAEGESGAPVIAPGEPGAPAETLSAGEAREAAEAADPEPNEADRAFMTMMIAHHEQAVVMTDLALEHADDGDVRRFAERLDLGQESEIEAMRSWLDANGGAADHGHDHGGGGEGDGGMPGMASEEQLAELRAARGEDFDRLFLRLMITHHEGAVVMADDEAASGSDEFVLGLASDLAATQGPEIDRMTTLLDELG